MAALQVAIRAMGFEIKKPEALELMARHTGTHAYSKAHMPVLMMALNGLQVYYS